MSSADCPPSVLVVMGVSGSGKSTIAHVLADRLGWPFQEGDNLHPPANVAKMASGHPLTDDDRWPWLEKIGEWIDERGRAHDGGVVTCSALRRAYRDVLARGRSNVIFVYLEPDAGLISARLLKRHGHYMPASLLESQFAALEVPGADEAVIAVSIGDEPEVIADQVIAQLRAGV